MHVYLGIDISKDTFDACLLREGQKTRKSKFNNAPHGFAMLEKWLKSHDSRLPHTCVEATGIYDLALCEYLYSSGYKISRMNPLQIKKFGQAEMLRSKTDSSDSALIAKFCKIMNPRAWKPDPKAVKELRELVRCLDGIIDDQVRVKCRLEKSSKGVLISKKYLLRQLASLKDLMKELEDEIQLIIEKYPQMLADSKLLTSIPGVGQKSINRILAHIRSIDDYEGARELAAHLGITPCHRQSGTSVNGSSPISKMGNAKLRKALYLPTMTAMRHNPVIARFAQRLTHAGKAPKVVILASMRKLIHIIFGVLKFKRPFDLVLAEPKRRAFNA